MTTTAAPFASPPRVSVVLCTHNPRRNYLDRTLQALRQQTLPMSDWEMLFVDNASASQLSRDWDLSWHRGARHVREDELGLTAARLRGIQESSAELIVFVDDDNVLSPDFLAQAQAIHAGMPHLGAFGAGRIEPEFERTPSAKVQPQLPLLALRSVAQIRWSNNAADPSCIPWGAGLCVTRPVALAYVDLVRRLNVNTVLGRRGAQLLCGEDDLFSWAAAGLGLGFGVFPALSLTHLIAAERLEQGYFYRLVHGHAFSHGVIGYVLAGEEPPSEPPLRHGLRLILHGCVNGTFSLRCQWAAHTGRRRAARFIREHRLHPVGVGDVALTS